MSNLLPERNKKQIKREYFLRLSIVTLVFVFITLVLSFVFLIPSYVLSSGRADSATEKIEFLKDYLEKRKKTGTNATLLSTNEQINVLNLNLDQDLSRAINLILSEKSNSIKINSFTFRETNKGEKIIFIGGKAQNRDSLIDFSKSLEGLNKFVEVVLPVSNLAKNKDINFNINLIIVRSSL